MNRKQIVALIVLVPSVIVAGLVLGRSLGGSSDGSSEGISISSADGATDFAFDITIPPGTAGRIAAGEQIEIVPAELVVHVGDALEDHEQRLDGPHRGRVLRRLR